MRTSIFIVACLFCASCSKETGTDTLIANELIEKPIHSKKPCPISVNTSNGMTLKIRTSERSECLQLSYGSNGLQWPLFVGISYHLKTGGDVTGETRKTEMYELRNSDLSFNETEIEIKEILLDMKKTGVEPSDIEWFEMFSYLDEEIRSNRCRITEGSGGYSISCN